MKRPETALRLPRLPFWLGTGVFTTMAIFFLWTEHRAHLLGALPWLLLLACPLLHLGMHRGHGHHGNDHDTSSDSRQERPS